MSAVKLGLVDVSSILQPLLVQYIYTLVTAIVVDLQCLTKYVYEQTLQTPWVGFLLKSSDTELGNWSHSCTERRTREQRLDRE
jgi:hypothetical protein